MTNKDIDRLFGIDNYLPVKKLQTDEEILKHIKLCIKLTNLFEMEDVNDTLLCIKALLENRRRTKHMPDTISVNARSMYMAWKEIERLERTTPDGEEDDGI